VFAAFPPSLQQVFVFLAGCCFGSLFNVIIYRLPANESIVRPGSHCPRCSHPIPFHDNIPLLSYLILWGRCRYCGEHISLRYPLVEGLTGVVVLVLFLRYGWVPQFLVECVLASLLILVTFIDLDTELIPDVLSLSGLVLGFAFSFLTPRVSWLDSLLGMVLGGGFFYLIAVGYQQFRHKDGLGGGDIKLLAMIGAFLGWPGVVFTVLTASVIGTVVGSVVMWRSRKGLDTRLPFGPFLAGGAMLYLFWGEAFYHWYVTDMLGL
jgi:leader peptidase (prepilin peptidase) / N-methyltransferase